MNVSVLLLTTQTVFMIEAFSLHVSVVSRLLMTSKQNEIRVKFSLNFIQFEGKAEEFTVFSS